MHDNYYRAVGVGEAGIFMSQFDVVFDATGKGKIIISKDISSAEKMGWLDNLSGYVHNFFPVMRYRTGKGNDFIICVGDSVDIANGTMTINFTGHWASDGMLYTGASAWIMIILLYYK